MEPTEPDTTTSTKIKKEPSPKFIPIQNFNDFQTIIDKTIPEKEYPNHIALVDLDDTLVTIYRPIPPHKPINFVAAEESKTLATIPEVENEVDDDSARSVDGTTYYLICPKSPSILNHYHSKGLKVVLVTARALVDKQHVRKILDAYDFAKFDIICTGGTSKGPAVVREVPNFDFYQGIVAADDLSINLESYYRLGTPLKCLFMMVN